MSQLTCHSSMLRGCHHVAPASQTATESARHLSQYVKSHSVCGSFWISAGERVPKSGMHYNTNQRTHAFAILL